MSAVLDNGNSTIDTEIPEDSQSSSPWSARKRLASKLLTTVLVGVNIVGLYYLGGMLALERIDDRPTIEITEPTEGGMRSVDAAIHLLEREVNEHRWVVNDPFFVPGALLDNMGAYQEGIIHAIGRFTTELSDQLGRARGSSRVDADLESAAGLLRFPGDVWVFDFQRSWAPTVTSEEQYREAIDALRSYNMRLSSGSAQFHPRADNLLVALERISADIGSQGDLIENYIASSGFDVTDQAADYVFYFTKGKLYAYYILIEAIGQDFEAIIQNEGLAGLWPQMLTSFREASILKPIFVSNSRPGGFFLASHLAEIGFYMLRAKAQLLDVTDVLAARR